MSGWGHRGHRVRRIGHLCRLTREGVVVPVLRPVRTATHGIAILDHQFLAVQDERHLSAAGWCELRAYHVVGVARIAHCNLAALWRRLAGHGLRDGLVIAID